MNKQNIVEKYSTSITKVNEVLRALDIDIDTEEFSPEQIQILDQIWHLVRQEKKTYQEAIALIKNPSADCMDAVDMDLDPQLTSLIDQQLAAIAQRFAGEAPYIIKQQQEQVRRYIVRKYWEKLNGLVASGEMQRAFERVLGADSLEAQILPGESPALPESSSSDT
ncbi:hypothetical protein [[Limnothrix rosea] IAM M-220]|uniref:hypothetical protein n=1 Tax=[Limnothrix rosea] IAM M-220 TaxID=454133 RepID=UPI00095A5C01|nr:hypothetical protein [[Limnothrix rosea] IAM M-220]OKH17652.1 hypothetical protein NIES208_08335 [[Limnothrix rosea] IAM M-220]